MSKRTHKKLYQILHDLDGELQMLGVRGDWGILQTPRFARETLECCLTLLSREPGAGKHYLRDGARHLINCELQREISKGGDSYTAAESSAANEANAVSFTKLLKQYRADFSYPGLQ
jgi:hypothetical protein